MHRTASLALLNRLAYALMVVDERARVVIVNARAREIVSRAMSLQMDGDVVRAVSAEDDRELQSAIAAATTAASSWLSGTSALRVGSGHLKMPILVLPANIDVDPLLGRRGLAFIVFGRDDPTPHADLLVTMYGLTGREADLACALLDGQDLAGAARALCLSTHTARTHLRHLMEKTHTTRQADLIRVLLGSIPPRA